MEFHLPVKNKNIVLTLGAESAGNFSIFENEKIYFSENFGDLLEEKNWHAFQNAVLSYLKNNKIRPDVIITDLHPDFLTTHWGKELSKKLKAEFHQVQHHEAHIFSAIGNTLLQNTNYGTRPVIAKQFYGVAMDGTGYSPDGMIWGGECFKISNSPNCLISNPPAGEAGKIQKAKCQIERIGHLENQTLIGQEKAIQEPARVLLAILAKFMDKISIYQYMEKYYSRNEFELLYSQLKQRFNCIETSSTGRVLDAISLLLGFCNNKRKYKHEAIDLLEKNSTTPYLDIKPKIYADADGKLVLDTTYLFNYVIKYLHKDQCRLAATAQLYIAQGFYEIIKKHNKDILPCTQGRCPDVLVGTEGLFLSGGLSENRIIKNYFISQGLLENKKPCVPKGDAGLSFGQIIWYLLHN